MGLLRRSLELGLGALAVTKQAAEDLLHAWDGDSGDDPEGERRQQLGALLTRARQFQGELAAAVRDEVSALLERSGWVRREEYEALRGRVDELERKLAGDPDIEVVADL